MGVESADGPAHMCCHSNSPRADRSNRDCEDGEIPAAHRRPCRPPQTLLEFLDAVEFYRSEVVYCGQMMKVVVLLGVLMAVVCQVS